MLHVFGCQQDLSGMPTMFMNSPFGGFDQDALPHGGHGLEPSQIGGTVFQSKSAHASPHGSGTYQYHLPTGFHHLVNLFRQAVDSLLIKLTIGPGQDSSAHFDHYRRRGSGDFLANKIGHDFLHI
jgi:hypothetical protein